jgi:large subunit ribosomal protein L32
MHLYIKQATLTVCPRCKKPVRPHTVCLNCGYYKGEEIINVLGKLTKKERKIREKQIKKAEEQEKIERPLTMEELSKR